LLVCVAATSWAQTLSPLSKLRIYDANGKKVGQVLDLAEAGGPFQTRAAFRVGDHAFVLEVSTAGFVGGWSLHYETTDCTGTPYVGGTGLVETARVEIFPGSPDTLALYVRDPVATPQTVTISSTRSQTGCDQLIPPDSMPDLVPAVRLIDDLSTLYTPPFRVR